MQTRTLLLFFLLIVTTCQAQNKVHMTGFAKSAFDKKPIPYTTIKIRSQEIYTATNNEGYFEINYVSKTPYDSLLFTCLGFKPKNVAVSGFRYLQEVFLDPSVVQLQDVVVVSGKKMTSKQIVAKAIERIPLNYADTFMVEGYFRRYQKIDSSYISFLDASVEITDDQFAEKNTKKSKESVRVLAVRKSISFNEKGYTNWADSISENSNWLLRLLQQNDVRTRTGLLDKDNVFDTVGYATFNDKLCYEIKVLKKRWHYVNPKTPFYQGHLRLVIDPDDYSIYRITSEEHSSNTSDKKQFPWGKKINSQLSARMIGGTHIVEFRRVKNKLVLNYTSDSFDVEDFKTKTGETVHANRYGWELFVNNVKKVPVGMIFPKTKERDFLRMDFVKYDPAFWKSYNMIPFTKENYQAFEDLGKKMPIEEQFSKSASQK